MLSDPLIFILSPFKGGEGRVRGITSGAYRTFVLQLSITINALKRRKAIIH